MVVLCGITLGIVFAVLSSTRACGVHPPGLSTPPPPAHSSCGWVDRSSAVAKRTDDPAPVGALFSFDDVFDASNQPRRQSIRWIAAGAGPRGLCQPSTPASRAHASKRPPPPRRRGPPCTAQASPTASRPTRTMRVTFTPAHFPATRPPSSSRPATSCPRCVRPHSSNPRGIMGAPGARC